MNVKLIAHTPDPEKIVACSAKLCYSNSDVQDLMDGLTDEKVTSFVDMLTSIGHQSPIEHISFTFAIEGISRSCSHQLVRHRIASYSQQSQRYVDMDNFVPVIPSEITNNEKALAIFNEAIEHTKTAYHQMSDILKEQYINDGLDPKVAKKMAIENARSILPNACETKIMVTMNARTLIHFFNHRCCNRAQDEIKQVADLMLQLVKPVAPSIFKLAGPSCLRGRCPEGKMTCGKMSEVIKNYSKQ